MNPFQLGAAIALLAGALVALSARDSRWILAGLVASLGLAPLVADPLPSPIAIAARLVAAILGAELLIVALRESRSPTGGAPLGPASIAFAAAAAGVVGYATAGVGSPADGPAIATGAGFALATLAVGPLLLGRDILRIGSATVLLVSAASLVQAGLAGTPGALEQGALAGATIAVLGATAVLAAAALRAGHDLSVAGVVPRETLFEAHPFGGPARPAPSAGGAPAGSPPALGAPEARRAIHTRTVPGRTPAAGPRRDAAAHQLTLEERLRLELPEAKPDAIPDAKPDGDPSRPAGDPSGPVDPPQPG